MDVPQESLIKVETLSSDHELPSERNSGLAEGNSQIDIDEMNIKLEIKQEIEETKNTDAAENDSALGGTNFKFSGKTKSASKHRKWKTGFGEFGDFTLLQCPACDITFKGGMRRAASLLNHVKKKHIR